MNRAYKLVWNAVSNSWIVASELAKGRKKSSSTALKLAVLMVAGLTAGVASAAPAANALPTGESVSFGSATFDRTVANQLTVNQSTTPLITDWNSFNVGSSAKVIFSQPTATSVAVNRITSGSATEIFGQVTANGQLVIVNPNGITFGAGSQVSAAAITASVMDITNIDALFGNMAYSRGSATGSIDNQGSLTATAGSVSLLAPTVKNSGSIMATGGNVNLINADTVNLSAPDASITGASSITGLIQQTGSITATQVSSVGGKILLTGDTSQSSSQIKLAGTLDATTNTNVNGRSIVVNGDVNLNGTSNVLDFTSTDGYSLTNAAQVNLNGASSGFSVNGTAYTVVRDVTQLQEIGAGLTGNYVLGSDIDASSSTGLNAGLGFAPIGTDSAAFTGKFDGLGHVISNLYINRPSSNYVGLFGVINNATLQHVNLSNVNITGAISTGSLLSYVFDNGVTGSVIRNNSVIGGTVSGSDSVGGLIGSLYANAMVPISVTGNYTNVTINAPANGGGLIGNLHLPILLGMTQAVTISNNYSGGVINGGSNLGGLIGQLNINAPFMNSPVLIENNSSNASVNATGSYAGGLIGFSTVQVFSGTSGISISRNYASGAVSGATSGGLFGFFTSFSTLPGAVNNFWNMDTTQQLLSGASGNAPTATGITTAQSKQLATFSSWGSSIDAQGGTGSVWRIYDGQSGPLLRSFLKPLTVSAGGSKTYDGVAVTGGGYTLSDAGADSSKILGTAQVTGTVLGARNAGTYTQGVSGLYSGQDGYDLNFVDGQFVINKRVLTISATAASKEYDGKLTSSDKPTVLGRQRGDAIVGLTQSYLDKNAGTGKTINVDAGFTIRDGNNGNNYDVVIVNSNAGIITPKAITISTVANSKVYDGGVTSANKPLVTGLLSGDRVTGLFQQYETKTVGTGKKLLIKSGYVVNDGNGGNNYTVTEQGSNDGVITVN